MMRSFLLSEAARWLGATAPVTDISFQGVCTDTRTINPGDLFVALRGERFDGHRFLADAVKAGASSLVVETLVPSIMVPQIKVADTTEALATLAFGNRRDSNARFVAVTGSSGKTTVKEMLAAILRGAGETLATRGNLNNHIGVPLTLFDITPDHQFAVIELGASGVGEIAHTVSITRPDVAIITNAGEAHLEGFGSYENIVATKGEIIDGVIAGGTVVLNRDDPAFDIWRNRAGERKVVSVGSEATGPADYTCETLDSKGAEQVLRLHGPDHWTCDITFALLGKHNRINALLAVAAVRELGVDEDCIRAGLAALEPVPGRLEAIVLAPDITVIDDSYNANPTSIKAALEVLSKSPGRHVAVLGGMAELGEGAERLHEQVGEYARQLNIDTLIVVGEQAKAYRTGFGEHTVVCADHRDAINYVETQLAAPVTVLVKGSRSSTMNLVVEGLKNKVTHSCCSG
ncbi:MAG: UDP-N-acetylmuramoyl-tripeptide--D-alanyl-D-alanine ligase [Marinobacter sp.]|uniref:UDP-N-acetylmuramoyl-tripeptide--D-alanyl-D- alanine ligase n=1 Tax=Marinobacter sp. TaxID=50741 RepID=UPI00349FE652